MVKGRSDVAVRLAIELPFRAARRSYSSIGHGGYMYTTQEVPVADAGSFNFTFDGGIGVEVYRSRTKSVSLEYRYHHFSNNNTASANPGVDNGLFQATYSFGR